MTSPPLDNERFDRLYDLCASDDVVDGERLFENVASSLRSGFAELVACAADREDWELASEVVHRILGISSMFGAVRLAALCRTLDEHDLEAQASDVIVWLGALERELRKAVSAIEARRALRAGV